MRNFMQTNTGRRVGAAALLALGGVLAAQSAEAAKASVNVYANLIRAPRRVAMTSELNFGVLRGGATAGTVTIAPTGGRTSTGGAELLGNGGAGPAEFQLRGRASGAWRMTLPGTVTAFANGGNQSVQVMNLRAFAHIVGTETTSGALDASGAETVSVGGTAVIPPGQPTGRYTADIAVTVTYE